MATDVSEQLDVARIKQDFPILQRLAHGRQLVYLDSAATSQKPRAVLDALERYYSHSNANVHRGVYELAEEATAAYESARETVASFIGATPPETIFVRNATEAINLVARTWGRHNIGPGDLIVLTEMEHHSNLVPWQILASEVGAELAFMGPGDDGTVDLALLDTFLDTGRVKLVATTYISNVLGTIVPVQEVARRAHAHGATILVDAAQAVPHLPVNVRALDLDFLACTGHKMLGPMGIGVLYGRRDLLQAMPPFLGGGEMIRHVGLRESTWNELPWKFEAGTPSVGDAVALATGIQYLQAIGMDAVRAHDRQLTLYAMERLQAMDEFQVYGPQERGAVVAFSHRSIHPHDLASLLDEQGIAVRAGQHCAEPLHDRLGVVATTRASFYIYNDEDDVDCLVEGLEAATRLLAS